MNQDGLAYLSRDKGGGWDQIALIRYIWPWGKHVTFSHDSYTCKKFSGTHPFPTVGQYAWISIFNLVEIIENHIKITD